MNDDDFWSGKRVFLTGHTGFKGAWLSLWLQKLGARVTGFALEPPTKPSLFELARVTDLVDSRLGDIRDIGLLGRTLDEARPEIVLHLAAQPLVRTSYHDPVSTFATNVMGTVHLLEAVRYCSSVRAVVIVTSDKCYENREWVWGYRETEPLGGYDPYSSSKGCSELVTSAYRQSYFNPERHSEHGVAVASARAGNVIGGGDWAPDRLVADCVRALLSDQQIVIRNPRAVRPWQHVLEPLSGYLLLARRLYEDGPDYADAWNFGPDEAEARPVSWVVERLCELWGAGASSRVERDAQLHEANYLKLDSSRARALLGWRPRWSLEQALASIVTWTRSYRDSADLRQVCATQIDAYNQAPGGQA